MFKLTHFRFIAAIHTVVGLKVHYTIVSLVKKVVELREGKRNENEEGKTSIGNPMRFTLIPLQFDELI